MRSALGKREGVAGNFTEIQSKKSQKTVEKSIKNSSNLQKRTSILIDHEGAHY